MKIEHSKTCYSTEAVVDKVETVENPREAFWQAGLQLVGNFGRFGDEMLKGVKCKSF